MRSTKVLDFQTGADVAKAEQEGEVVYYGHDGEAAIGVLLDAFKKDFPKIKTSYVRLQTGALYAKITAERSAGRFGVDVLQVSDISPAIDFQKKGGTSSTSRRSMRRTSPSTSRIRGATTAGAASPSPASPTTAPR